jgi:hypothetical protein
VRPLSDMTILGKGVSPPALHTSPLMAGPH